MAVSAMHGRPGIGRRPATFCPRKSHSQHIDSYCIFTGYSSKEIPRELSAALLTRYSIGMLIYLFQSKVAKDVLAYSADTAGRALPAE